MSGTPSDPNDPNSPPVLSFLEHLAAVGPTLPPLPPLPPIPAPSYLKESPVPARPLRPPTAIALTAFQTWLAERVSTTTNERYSAIVHAFLDDGRDATNADDIR